MDSFYYLCGLIAIGWVTIWTCTEPKKTRKWSPFDLKDDMIQSVAKPQRRGAAYTPRYNRRAL